MAVQAWLFDPHSRTVSAIQYKRDRIPHPPLLSIAARAEKVTPYEYCHVSKLLGTAQPDHVALYNVRQTANYVYKVWACDVDVKNGPGTRFYKTNATFYEKVILIKLKRDNQPVSDLVDCERPEFAWMDKVDNPETYFYSINHGTQEVIDLLYKCANCSKCCGSSRCGKCKSVFYCNSTCQRAHWKQHKLECV